MEDIRALTIEGVEIFQKGWLGDGCRDNTRVDTVKQRADLDRLDQHVRPGSVTGKDHPYCSKQPTSPRIGIHASLQGR